jgi:hypothetical protein
MNEVDACPNCHMPRDEWPDDRFGGFERDGRAYCCKGCAEGTGCTCPNAMSERAPTKEEIRRDPASAAFVQAHQRETKHVDEADYGTDVTSGPPPRTSSND